MITKHQKGFSMLTAVVVIVTMSVLASFVMSTASKTIKTTADQYRKEQAMLYAKSYTEYAIMAVSANWARVQPTGAPGECLDTITAIIARPGQGGPAANNGRGTGYAVRVNIAYIGSTGQVQNCPNDRQFGNTGALTNDTLNIIVDAYVNYNDLNDPRPDPAGQPINLTYHRRSLQKI